MRVLPFFEPHNFVPEVMNGWEPGQRSVVITVGGCLETSCAVMYRCHLAHADDVQPGCWEFSFDVQVDWLDASQEAFNTMDRNMAFRYVPQEVRGYMIPAVCRSIEALVEDCKPAMVYRVTKSKDMPAKAFEKHHIITGCFITLGYQELETGLDRANRFYWLMGR